MGIINSIGVSIGNSLNNTRLLMNNRYQENNLYGDYNRIFIISSILSLLVYIFLSKTILVISVYELFLSLLLISLVSFRAYYSVGFRIVIDYKKIVCSNLFGAIGYALAVYNFKMLNSWLLIFVIGELCSCIYIFINSTLVNEGFKKTDLFNASMNKYFYILLASILSSTMLYMDRFLIYPILGAELVSVYTVASFLGKSAGILLNPIAGVLLTYYVNEKGLTKKLFLNRVLYFGIIIIIFYITIDIGGEFVTKILYPTIIDKALPYLSIANFAAIIFIFGNIIQPSLLRYSHSRWQTVTQVSYLIIYLISTYLGMTMGGLLGFCIGILLANVYRVIFMIVVIMNSIEPVK